MTVRVRFAPSPTGFLHIGGARTALYNYLFARAQKGTFILRIEDTDQERSTKEFEESQVADLKWLGLDYDEGPDKPGDCGPYRQSERLDIYKKYAEEFVAKGQAFYCFCTDEELDAKKEQAMKEERAPHYDGKCRTLTSEEVQKRLADGETATIRFRVPKKSYTVKDHVRGEVVFPEDMVGDFVIMRSSGLPVYNYCCVIDDWLMKITHVIRAEDHLPNTLRQLMVYEALGATPPEFAHASLLVGKDRQKLSKRHGATSVTQYRENSFLPEAMLNYLCLLGWSHPEEKTIFDQEELEKIFDIDRFSKSAALFDVDKFRWVNEQYLRNLPTEELITGTEKYISENSSYHGQSDDWKGRCLNLFKEKVQAFNEFEPFVEKLFMVDLPESEKLTEIFSWESTPKIKEYLKGEIEQLVASGVEFASEEDVNNWSNHIKKELKVKGKFLFMGMRAVLTKEDHGSDLKQLIPLTPLKVLKERM